MIGAGAIGCELLKNFSMLSLGTARRNKSKKIQGGSIILTDPDIIEMSNLSRQFLFREKHLRRPKSSIAAAAAIQMNPLLKNHIFARLDKICDATNHIFTDSFFDDLSVVCNALDNVQARRYVDSRCVMSRKPLLESGTMGPKGHVQVIIPFKTESYSSQADPEDNTGDIPHCTLKMFPEEALHCVEWARDRFSNIFDLSPRNLLTFYNQQTKNIANSSQDFQQQKISYKLLKNRPKSFKECIY